MDLFSLSFLVFVLVSVILYYTVFRHRSWICLLAAGIFYYAVCGISNFPFLLLSALSTWAGALVLTKISVSFREKRKAKGLTLAEKKALKKEMQQRKKIVLFLVITLNLGVLAFMKLASTGALSERFSLWLPLGISFYTFQSIGYLIDVSRDKYEAEKNFLRYFLFLSWFPQLLQGPIGRYDVLAPQLFKEHSFDADRTKRSLLLILFGLLKKYAIADLLAPSIAALFDGPVEGLPGSLVVFGILLYSAQQYADFSGGIDIMRGVSSLYGITLSQNFRQPYFSTSLGDFWRRWHISLGSFMRDYVFYPIALTTPMQKLSKFIASKGSSKNTTLKKTAAVVPASIANLIVFFLVGIWHGIEIHYILWGLYNGLVIALSDLTAPFWSRLSTAVHLKTSSRSFHIFRVIRTFIIVNIGWYFDRIIDPHSISVCFHNTFFWFAPDLFWTAFDRELLMMSETFSVLGGFFLAALTLCLVFIVSLKREKNIDVAGYFLQKSIYVQAILIVFALFVLVSSFLFTTSAGGFMYANF